MAWYDDTKLKTAIREYKSTSDLERDANRAAEFGWSLVSTSEQGQRTGCMRMLTLGLFALIWKPKSRIMATYRRE